MEYDIIQKQFSKKHIPSLAQKFTKKCPTN